MLRKHIAPADFLLHDSDYEQLNMILKLLMEKRKLCCTKLTVIGAVFFVKGCSKQHVMLTMYIC